MMTTFFVNLSFLVIDLLQVEEGYCCCCYCPSGLPSPQSYPPDIFSGNGVLLRSCRGLSLEIHKFMKPCNKQQHVLHYSNS